MNLSAREKYVLQNYYHKPNEFYAVAAYIVMFIYFGFVLQLNPLAKYGLMAVTGLMCALRCREAFKVLHYRRNLRQLAHYELTSAEIPQSNKALFLGLGFRWTQVHTQRLTLARTPEYLPLSRPSKGYMNARRREINEPHAWLSQLTRSSSIFNPYRPLPPVGGDTALHGVEPHEDEIWLDIGERVGHTLVLGTTRVGKTRMAEVMITQDIKRGDVTIVFDPKGDGDLLKRMWIEAHRAGRPFYMFHLGHPQVSARYNPIGSYSKITEIATRIANQLPGDGQSAAFRDFVWGYLNVLAKCMEALGYKATYTEIYAHATNIDKLALNYMEHWMNTHQHIHKLSNWEEDFGGKTQDEAEAKLAKKQGRDPKAMHIASYMTENGYRDQIVDSLIAILSKDKSYFEKLVSSLYPLLEKLTSGQIAGLISPDPTAVDNRPIFDWMSVIQTGAVVYIGLDSLSDAEVAGAVGNAMFADLTSIAGQLYKYGTGYGESSSQGEKRKIAIHADEFNELIGDEFIPLLNKAGGAGYQVTVYTQTWSDVEAKIGSAAKAGQIGGNLNNMIMLRVKTLETAEMLTSQLPEVNVVTKTQLSGASDASDPEVFEDFTTQNEDRVALSAVPMITPADLVSLPKGQAFALIEGGQLFKIRLPLMPSLADDPDIPSDIVDIASEMNNKLSRAIDEVELSLTVEGQYYGE
ncbi:type IV conjugative transfer system coupling protein TraD [Hydromonas duriensis]|uniref:Conjugal transfer pilus assembly protein TraD n=1 Tax=Hydromonas duriensis TaxID=1527608 RepID=A0A4R6Y1X3_9BURK|nr:type IV conjugative transfer system coupling protein TraD [Hydromonas duriensis]TDR30493.1 conjugal transfer pilus assembly protein TraD [Hydromonas duriensis]